MAVARWLPRRLDGADAVLAEVARRLATAIDNPATPAYVLPRLAGSLLEVVREVKGAEPPAGRARVIALLGEVVGRES